MKKKILAAVIAFSMVFGCAVSENFFPADFFDTLSVSAETLDNGLRYEICDDYVKIIGYSGADSKVEIPSEIEGLPVVSIESWVFEKCTSLTEIKIPDSVTDIGSWAFSGCTNLTKITIPDSVTTIGWHVFSGCASLTKITIPDSVTSIGNEAFSYCKNLTEITIPDSVTDIGSWAFAYCKSLTEITIPDSVTTIGFGAFHCCLLLKEVTIPASVAEIEGMAFGYYEENDEWQKVEDFKIYGVKGSAAEEYANKNGFEFISLGEAEKPPISDKKKYDIDGDGDVTARDALNILQIVVGEQGFTAEQKKLADVDGDGEITPKDALCVLQAVVGIK